MTVDGADGFVSIEVAPELARDTDATVNAARDLHQRIALPNLFVKIPATAEGIPAIRTMTAEGRSINVTLIFSLHRYAEVIDAYIERARDVRRGRRRPRRRPQRRVVLREPSRHRGRPAPRRHRDRRGPGPARSRRRRASQARAINCSASGSAGERWERLAALGAHVQRPLWASTSTKNPAYADTRLRRRPHRARHRQHAAREAPSPRSRTTASWPAPSTQMSTTRTT